MGEPVFDATTQVERRVPDPVTDDTLPAPGSLIWDGITEETGLTETKGSDTRLITGDDFKKVK